MGGLRRPTSGTISFDGRDITRIRGDDERLDIVELETLTVPLSLRDKRALQVLADRRGEPVGALVARLVAEHVQRERGAEERSA